MQLFSFLLILLFVTACNAPAKKDLPTEKDHPKLIKTIGSPKYGNVNCSLQDKAGNLWFGTTENGLYKYDGKSFTQFLMADGLNSNNISCLLEDKEGKIWIGTEAGLCLYDARQPDSPGKTFAEIKIPLPKNLPPNKHDNGRNLNWVFSIMQAKNGNIWLATVHGVYIYDGKLPAGTAAAFTPFIVDENSGGYMNTNNNVEKILEDKAGNTWLGGRANEGVYRYDGKSITHFKLPSIPLEFGTRKVSHNWAWPQLQDKAGNIWFSNWAGVYRYDGKTFTSITTGDGLPGYNGVVKKIIEDKNGRLWFAGDKGLSRYDGRSFTLFNDGLINPDTWTVLEDRNGNFWLGTRATGLYLFDGKKFILYSAYKPGAATN